MYKWLTERSFYARHVIWITGFPRRVSQSIELCAFGGSINPLKPPRIWPWERWWLVVLQSDPDPWAIFQVPFHRMLSHRQTLYCLVKEGETIILTKATSDRRDWHLGEGPLRLKIGNTGMSCSCFCKDALRTSVSILGLLVYAALSAKGWSRLDC